MLVKIDVRALMSRVENMTKIHGNQDTDPGDVEIHKDRSIVKRSFAVF